MDGTKELIATLKAGNRVKLVIGKGESISNAHALFNQIEREHGLSLGRQPCISGSEVYFVIWAEGIGASPLLTGVVT
jgi:hypothetical protein